MKLSVCMITYNHEKYIAQAVESVLMQQTNFDYELVIGEDCSTDRTREIVIEYKNKYPNKINLLLPEKNLGMIPNFVQTLQVCKGKYIAMLEGDDYWTYPYKLQKQVDQLEANPAAMMVAHRANIVDVNNNIMAVFPSEQPAVLKPKYIITKGGGSFATSSIMIRKALLMNLPDWFYKFPIGDSALVNLALNRGEIGFINDVMSAYRQGIPSSWSSRTSGIKKGIKHLLSLQKAYYMLIRQEKRYTYWYYRRMSFTYWWIVKIIAASILKHCCV